MSSYHTRIIRRLREVSRRRGGLTSAQRAILEFHSVLEANSDGPSRALQPKAGRSDEDERRMCSACEREEDDASARYCRACGSRLQDEDEDERTDEAEGRRVGVDDENPLGQGQPKYRGQSTPKHSERFGSEAVREFRTSYRKARESAHTGFQGIPKGF